ncbi:hypothetical protein ACGFSD_29020 [Streptomyces caniferus]
MDKLDTKEAALHAQIAENATGFEKVAGVDTQLRELTTEKGVLKMR